MQRLLRVRGRKVLLFSGLLAVFLFFTMTSLAQTPAARISAEIDNSERAAIQGTHPPMARPENDAGRVPAGTALQGISIVFSRTPAQEADLQALIAAQQDSTSPQYHKWLTADEFAVRFGVADADIEKVQLWLQQQGFSIEGVSRSKNRITFSGTTGQAEAAFATELHYYNVNGRKEFAPSTDIAVPAALSSLVQTATNLSTFQPKPHVKFGTPRRVPRANFTSSQSGDYLLTPKDIATIYGINAAYNAGYTGAGQSIAVVGQSSVVLSDIENFQIATGLTKKDPTLVLVPNSGTATVVTGDESESDLDLEYSSTIAKGATIFFVYVGNNPNYSVWDSLTYTIENHTAPIIGISYGTCEQSLGAGEYSSLNGLLAQAASQGQSVVAAAGDNGSTDCYGTGGLTTAQQEVLAVDFPASSQYVTGMGGTEFLPADVAPGNTTYWESAGSSDVLSSALSYIPEQVWNDDTSADGLSSGGGGVSSLTPRPAWQTGVTGILSGSFRLVPDISLTASPNNAPFLYCSSDFASTGVTGSCSNGFRDSSDTSLTVAGGTSFGVPIFAGMLAMINQKLNSTGQGVVNPTLYKLAADPTTYASAFHDITSGNNECTAGPTYCVAAGESQYSAATGYDEATGLGSLDFFNLLTAWPTSGSSLAATTTTLSAGTTTAAPGASDVITITVAPAAGSSTPAPTGTLTVVVDGTTQTTSLALTSSGSATYTFSSTTSGSHSISATYSGDSTYASSTGSLTLTVSGSTKSFTLAAANATVSAGSSGTSAITITPQNGYTGTITWGVSSSPSISNACFSLSNTSVSGSSALTATLTIHTSTLSCASGAVIGTHGVKRTSIGTTPVASWKDIPPLATLHATQAGLALAGLLFFGLLGLRSGKLGAFSGVFLLTVVALALWGCGSAGSSSSPSASTPNAATGTYTLTIVGTDISSSSMTASTTMTLTID
jgi:subtilase family serine protease